MRFYTNTLISFYKQATSKRQIKMKMKIKIKKVVNRIELNNLTTKRAIKYVNGLM